MVIHIVKSGDTLYNISNFYGVPIEKLVLDNQISTPNKLAIGQNIVIDVDKINYTVKNGDTLYKISKMFDIPLSDIIESNPEITNPNALNVGQVVVIPLPNKEFGNIEVNGYAIANINEQVLNKTLPYLTYLAIFSYQAKDDGNMSLFYETNLIEKARANNVAPLMVVTNIGGSGGFNSDVAHSILTNELAQTTLINNILNTLSTKNYYGVDIDFEYIYPYDKESYIQFLKKLNTELKKNNYYLSVAVAPKYRENQTGLLYEAHDYKQIGEIADRVIIMTYEWGYMYGPPMAISPYDQVEQVLTYAVTAIPSNKILMGMPNYAYDWTYPYSPNNPATTLTNVNAVNLAIEKGATIYFDKTAKAPYFNYVDNLNKKHIVWFDNAESTYERLKLVDKFKLAGVSYWTINNFFNQNWLVLNSMFDIKKLLN